MSAPSLGLHGSFAWSCAAEGCGDDPNSSCTGIPFIAGTDGTDGTHAYAGCVEDILTNPVMYEGEDLVLHGTHQLTDEQLEEIYGPDRGMLPDYQPLDCTIRNNGIDDTSDLVTLAIGPNNQSTLLTAEALLDVLTNPDDYAHYGWSLYGTHVLPDEWLDELFGEKTQD